MGTKEDWVRSMGGNPARYRNLELPGTHTEHPENEFTEARCPGRSVPVRRRKASDALQASATGAASFGTGQPDRVEPKRCSNTRAKVLVKQRGRVRSLVLQCVVCGHTWSIAW